MTDSFDDQVARETLWKAIRIAAVELQPRCSVYTTTAAKSDGCVAVLKSIPSDQPMWKLVEVLSLLGILLRSEQVLASEITNILGKNRADPYHRRWQG